MNQLDRINVDGNDEWNALLLWMPQGWEAKMRESGGFVRARKIPSPSALLRLIVAYPVLRMSLPELADWAARQGIADVSFQSVWERLHAARPFLRWLLTALLDRQIQPVKSDLVFTPQDGTTFTLPGSTKRDWLVSLRWAQGRPIEIKVNKIGGKGSGESLRNFTDMGSSAVEVADRAYGTPPQLAVAQSQGRRFLVRFTWNNLPLWSDAAGGSLLDPAVVLGDLQVGAIADFEAWVRPKGAPPLKLRIVALRREPQSAVNSRKKSRKLSVRKGHTPRRQTLFLAEFVTLVTNLPYQQMKPDVALDAYRWRWQVEREFRRLKSTTGVRRLDNEKDETVEVYLLALLCVWLLASRLAREKSFFPWGYPV